MDEIVQKKLAIKPAKIINNFLNPKHEENDYVKLDDYDLLSFDSIEELEGPK